MNRSCVRCVHFDPAPGSLWGCPPAATDWSIAVGIPDGETAWPEGAPACPGYDKREPASSPDPSTQTQLPLDWPPLWEAMRAMAGEFAVVANVGGGVPDVSSWFALGRDVYGEPFLRLLADLRRPASRDHWARMLAHWTEMTVGVTAPSWIRWNDHGDGRFTWILGTYTQTVLFAPEFRGWHQTYTTRYVPELLDLPNPEAALRAALFSVHPEAADAP